MARIRTVKPELFQSYTVKRLSLEARWTFVGLLTHVDDDGYCRDEPRIVKGAIWPLEDEVSWSDVEKHIDELLHAGLACRFFVNGVAHLHIVNFREHQTINRPTKSRLPHCPTHSAPPPEGVKTAQPDTPPALFPESSVTSHAQLTEDSCTEKEVEVEVERELETEEELTPAAHVHVPPVDNSVPDMADADEPRGTEDTTKFAAKKRKSRAKKPTTSDPEAEALDKLAREVVTWWWERLPIKPAGKGAWFASLAVVKSLLEVGWAAKDVANAARTIGSPLTVPRMEIQLNRDAPPKPGASEQRLGGNVLPFQRAASNDAHLAAAMERARARDAAQAANPELRTPPWKVITA